MSYIQGCWALAGGRAQKSQEWLACESLAILALACESSCVDDSFWTPGMSMLLLRHDMIQKNPLLSSFQHAVDRMINIQHFHLIYPLSKLLPLNQRNRGDINLPRTHPIICPRRHKHKRKNHNRPIHAFRPRQRRLREKRKHKAQCQKRQSDIIDHRPPLPQ